MSPRPKSRNRPKSRAGRTRNTPRSPQTILAQARRNNLERALQRGDMRAALTGISSEDGGSGGARAADRAAAGRGSKVSKGRRQARKYSKLVALPASQDPLEEPLPAGYVFVPKGDVYITRHCRSQTKEAQQVVYVVYNNAGKRTLGLRVPAEIHASVCESASETASSRANAVQLRDAKDVSRSRQLLCTQFPLMPVESLEVVLDHAFLKGSGRVGRTSTKTDERKAVLAVEAHIRHVHTPYEELLESGMDRKEARDAVGGTVRAIRFAWEGGENRPSGLLTLRSR